MIQLLHLVLATIIDKQENQFWSVYSEYNFCNPTYRISEVQKSKVKTAGCAETADITLQLFLQFK